MYPSVIRLAALTLFLALSISLLACNLDRNSEIEGLKRQVAEQENTLQKLKAEQQLEQRRAEMLGEAERNDQLARNATSRGDAGLARRYSDKANQWRKRAAALPLTLEVVSFTSRHVPGGQVTLVVKTLPGAVCTLENYFSDESNAALGNDFSPKQADDEGKVSWTWRLPPKLVTAYAYPLAVTAKLNGKALTERISYYSDPAP